MKRTKIFDSASISSIGYDDVKKILEITFIPTGTYRYLNVHNSMYKALIKADSKGEFINKYIKWRYEFEKVK